SSEVGLAHAAVRAEPVVGHGIPRRAGRDAVFRPPFPLAVDEAADVAHPLARLGQFRLMPARMMILPHCSLPLLINELLSAGIPGRAERDAASRPHVPLAVDSAADVPHPLARLGQFRLMPARLMILPHRSLSHLINALISAGFGDTGTAPSSPSRWLTSGANA